MRTASRLQPRSGLSLLLLPAIALGLVFLLYSAFVLYAADDQPQAPQALGSIAGVVTDANGQPLAGIGVGLFTYASDPAVQITTTATGAFYFPALIPGVYGLRAVDPTGLYATQYYTATNNPARATDLVVNGNGLTGLAFRLQRAGGISGRITAAGALPPFFPNANNQVSLYNADGEIFTPLHTTKLISATGRYTFSALLPASYYVCASIYLPAAGYVPACYGAGALGTAAAVTVTSGVTQTNLDFDVDQGQFEGVISGTVTLRGAPAANLRVDLQSFEVAVPINLYTMTNAAGAYAFRGLPTGTYTARVSDPADRYPSFWHDGRPAGPGVPSFSFKTPLALGPAAVLSNVNVSLIEYGTIQGKAYRLTPPLRAGDMITVHLTLLHPESTIESIYHPKVDAAGNYSITRLFPGQYHVAFPACYFFAEWMICELRYYGKDPAQPGSVPPPVTLNAGQVLTGIDSLIGPNPKFYLPLLMVPTE